MDRLGLVGRRTVLKEEPLKKALARISLTESGKLIRSSEWQFPKAPRPTDTIESGKSIAVKAPQPLKAQAAINVTDAGI